MGGGGWGGGSSPGERGVGGIQVVGEEGVESGIPKVVGSGRNKEKHTTLHNILESKKYKEAGANNNSAGTRIKGYRKRKV